MRRAWIALVASVAILDVAIATEKVVFGGSQRELFHGLGVFIAPFYFGLAIAWLWIISQFTTALRKRQSADWTRILLLGALALVPILL